MKKFISILLAILTCIAVTSCGELTGTPPDPSYTGGSQTDTDKETDKETDGETDKEDDKKEEESDKESDEETEKPSGGTVITPIQPGGDYNVGNGYGK
jgi:hypothetical protein